MLGKPSSVSEPQHTRSPRGPSFFHPSTCPTALISDQEIIRQKMPLLLGMLGNVDLNSSATEDSGKPISLANATVRGGVVSQVQDRWETIFWTGEDYPKADELASDSLQSSKAVVRDGFTSIEVLSVDMFEPLVDEDRLPGAASSLKRVQEDAVLPGMPNNALMLAIDGKPAPASLMRTVAVTLGRFLALHRDRQTEQRRLWQATTMLQNAAKWQQLEDDDELLESIAQCACEVLACERATIFMWDKPRKRLVGRPAIGVKDGVLEVEDDAGIVGEVLQSGSPRWWADGGDDGERVNRRVDKAQNFVTRSLLAVPMINARGQIVGVFEAINANESDHRDGTFDASDVRTLSELSIHATVAIDSHRSRRNLKQSRDRLVAQAADSVQLIGEHPSITELRRSAAKVAPTDLTLLILGQNGTGKEVLAQHLHYESERRTGPFVAVNCAALVESLLESELFGHEKGAFTDASEARPGKFELASGGTLFLDEVGDMSPAGQAKLLRVLEQRVAVRVGGSQPIPVDTRVIAATNQPLQELIAAKKFREDLFFRLNVVSLTLPPLSGRGEDVLRLANHFLEQFCRQIGRTKPRFDEIAQRALLAHPWPGNVRELRNTIERLCYLTTGETITAEDLMLSGVTKDHNIEAAPTSDQPNLNDATREFQIAHIQRLIEVSGGNMTEAAGRLGLHRSNLYRKMRQLGMPTSGC